MNAIRICLLVAMLLVGGCTYQPEEIPLTSNGPDATEAVDYDSEWNDRNADIYRYLLSQLDEPIPNRIYFITTTPKSEWGESGNWQTIPADDMKSFPEAALYRPASEAHLKDHRVLENGSDAEAWMHWISVKRWLSDTEVEVEEGVWCCPLGGGASTVIYEKVDGTWRIKELGRSWVS
jgi:hypothetical protein